MVTATFIKDLSTFSTISGSRNHTISTVSGSRIFFVHIHNFWIQKLQYFCCFWIQKLHHFCNFWIIKWARENVPPRLLPTNGLGAADKWMMVTIFGWWPQGHHPRMVTIIHLSPVSTQPEVNMICTWLGGPFLWSFSMEFKVVWPTLDYFKRALFSTGTGNPCPNFPEPKQIPALGFLHICPGGQMATLTTVLPRQLYTWTCVTQTKGP